MVKECIVCGETQVLDRHHHRKREGVYETVWLCPNHHQMIHRYHLEFSEPPPSLFERGIDRDRFEKLSYNEIDNEAMKIEDEYRLSLTEILEKIRKIEEKGKCHLEIEEETTFKDYYRGVPPPLPYERTGNSENESIVVYKSNYAFGSRSFKKSELVSKIPKCAHCGYDKLLEVHHNKEGKIVFLCPNHHAINHRKK